MAISLALHQRTRLGCSGESSFTRSWTEPGQGFAMLGPQLSVERDSAERDVSPESRDGLATSNE